MGPQTPQAAMVIGYSTTIVFLIGLCFLWAARNHGLWRRQAFWLAGPFICAGIGGAFLTVPAILPGLWSLRIGSFFLIFAYGMGWQAIRVCTKQPPELLSALLPSAGSLALSIFDHATGLVHVAGSYMDVTLLSYFNARAAYDVNRRRNDEPSAISALFWVLALSAAFMAIRIPVLPWLPAPLGPRPTALWSVIVFNMQAMGEVLLVTFFLIVLPRDRALAQSQLLALRDPLTGVSNRRAFDEWTARQRNETSEIAVLAIDLDRFKAINDCHGHALGDRIIRLAAAIVLRHIHGHDAVYRIGGEEFVVILTPANELRAHLIAESIRADFAREAAVMDGIAIGATLSVGIARAESTSPTAVNGLMEDADTALYTAKHAGRNRIAYA
ncbi:sensor histidine kinase [Tanticharoenia sakaeratensis NBRC 103193]|uniref:diguanylate cyclase n=2 Tax=Tanticharoenia TaxID=444052 RepID=A0A0D6MLQ9_9PROT|nr:sensor histidine kinase [Tanticharoenia sakaeratensis NBRC 103193]GBQ23001.1 diguanylate cyclase [Tanticharoenia sakaeratensis NBRC 103193]